MHFGFTAVVTFDLRVERRRSLASVVHDLDRLFLLHRASAKGQRGVLAHTDDEFMRFGVFRTSMALCLGPRPPSPARGARIRRWICAKDRPTVTFCVSFCRPERVPCKPPE